MTHWRMRLNRGRKSVHVHADYHMVESGCLKFRNQRRGTYPENVIAFAHGEWYSVENLSVEQKP